jgi:hypothetical protein
MAENLFTDKEINQQRALLTHDKLLQWVMDVVFGRNDEAGPGVTFAVTVCAGGQVIGGQAVTFKAWIEGVKESFVAADSRQLADVLGRFGDIISDVAGRASADADERGLLSPGRQYLHFSEVHEGPLAGHEWVRVDLHKVEAWSFGYRGSN